MSDTTAGQSPVRWPEVPMHAWWLAWSFVASQVLTLVTRGPHEGNLWPVSVALSVLLVVFFSHGVMTAGLVRFWIVVVLLCLAAVGGLVGVLAEPSPTGMVALALTLVQLTLLRDHYLSEWFALQRQGLPGAPSLTPIMLVAVVVGVLGGVLGAGSNGASITINGTF